MSQFLKHGVADTYQLSEDIIIPAGTFVAIKKLEFGPWVLRADLLRANDTELRLKLPKKIERDLLAAHAPS